MLSLINVYQFRHFEFIVKIYNYSSFKIVNVSPRWNEAINVLRVSLSRVFIHSIVAKKISKNIFKMLLTINIFKNFGMYLRTSKYYSIFQVKVNYSSRFFPSDLLNMIYYIIIIRVRFLFTHFGWHYN